MEVCYADFAQDIDQYRRLGANENALARSEGLLNHYFFVIQKLSELEQDIELKNAHIARLQEQLFGSNAVVIDSQAEESDAIENDPPSGNEDSQANVNDASCDDADKNGGSDGSNTPAPQKEKKPGHGRLSADEYTGAERVVCSHDHLKPGDTCPDCLNGRLYAVDPLKRVVVDGRPPLLATLFLIEVLRCALCGERFRAQAPVDTTHKYTALSKSVLAYLHCGSGQPYNRIQIMQQMMGMPVPASTQSALLESMMGPLYPIFTRLIWYAANSDCIYQDDTFIKILALIKENKELQPQRKGMNSSGFVTEGENPVALFFPGRQHAGEHFDQIMAYRSEDANKIIRMADALKANSKHQHPAEKGKCNGHAVRRFKPITNLFPIQCHQILHWYSDVYDNEAYCKENDLTPTDRLHYHQKHSGPIMEQMQAYIKQQLDDKLVEPNGALGKEYQYLLNHWKELTLFLRVVGAPLDNNPCERVLKGLIMYRKNSQIYVTEYSAYNLHIITSIIITCRLNTVDAIDYLTQLQNYEQEVWANPDQWLPWCYLETIENLSQPPPDTINGLQSSAMSA